MKTYVKVVGDARAVNVDLRRSIKIGLVRPQDVLVCEQIENAILNCAFRVVQSE